MVITVKLNTIFLWKNVFRFQIFIYLEAKLLFISTIPTLQELYIKQDEITFPTSVYVFDFSFSVSFVTKALISIERRKSPKRNYFQPKTKHKAEPNTNRTTFNIIRVIPHRQTYQILKVTQVIRGHQKYLIIILPIFKIPLIFLDFQLLTKKLFSKKGFSRLNPELLHLSR